MRKIRTTFALLLILSGTAFGSVLYWPGYDWKTIETGNFRVHFHQGERNLAFRTAVIAEEVLAIIVGRMGYKPKGKIELILSDDQDDSNGSSTNFPVNTVRLYMATPHPSSMLDDYDDWLRILLMHELTHTVHMDMARGFVKGLRYVFGRIISFNHFSPVFEIEGLAVMHETVESKNAGRAQSAMGEMIVRGEWMSGKFPSIDKLANWTSDWPHGFRPYVLGGVFHKWVFDRYGESVWADIAWRHSGQVWPFCHNCNMKKPTGGKTLNRVYAEWIAYLNVKYEKLQQELEARSLTQTRQLTKIGDENRRPQFSPDGRYLYYEESTGQRRGRIRRIDLSNGKNKTVKRTGSTGDAAYFPDGRIAYTHTETDDLFRSYYDINLLDQNHRKTKSLSHGLRSHDIAAVPDGRRLLFIANELEKPSIGLLDVETKKIDYLYTTLGMEDLIQFAEPVYSPDGRTVALSVWHEDGNRDIFLFDPQKQEFFRVTFHAERDTSPAFSPDGNYLLFTSARTGIYNIFALDLVSQRLYQVTNVLGGAFDPAVSPDGKFIAFSGYGPRGYDIHLMDFDPKTWTEAPYEPAENRGFGICKIGREIDRKAEELKEETKESGYGAIGAILPTYWLPYWEIIDNELSLGIQTSGHDVLYHHIYSMTGHYSWEVDFFSYDLSYTNAILRPNFTISHSRMAVNYGYVLRDRDGDFKAYWEKRLSGRATMAYPVNANHTLVAQYLIDDRRPLTDIEDATYAPIERGIFSGLSAGWLYDGTDYYRESISVVDGAQVSFTYTAFSKIFGSDYEVHTWLGNYNHYFGLPFWNHVIAYRMTGGFAEGESLYLKAFRLGGFSNDQIFARASENRVFLRGYSSASRRGQRVGAGSLEYRLPLWRPQSGPWAWPIFMDTISMVAFGDAGATWNDMFDPEEDDILPGVGGELHLRFNIAYYYPVQFRLGYAYGLVDPDFIGGHHYIITFGGSF